ncbi:hypothetical protein DPEC_G00369910 [Dallia pectoralis]|nr:hypothetical protein DPEC_G00369910 [Dallia pectoralis]
MTCISFHLSQDTDRATHFHRTLLDEQKAQQAQERNQLQRAQRTEAKARLAHFKTELKKLGLSGPEHRQRLTVVGRGGQAAGGEAKFAAVAGGPAEGGAGAGGNPRRCKHNFIIL